LVREARHIPALYQKKATTVTMGSTGLSSTGEFLKSNIEYVRKER
jgi:hypothetical protein